ncbi:hypothetical protein IL306_001592 [Fusarium sp. DS 682]|nr:hypothetical protein IL306_001592 [Fusarium sp. DS 682]
MASAQEAEEIIRSLNGDINAKRFLYELLRYANGRAFTKAIARKEPPSITFRIYNYDKIVIDCNEDGLTKADIEAICQPVPERKAKEANFRAIVVASKKVHIQSGNFSFEFQHNIFDPEDSMIRPIWVSPTETISDNSTRITLYLHDQGSKEDVDNLRNIIHSQFEKLHEACLLFLKGLRSMRVEFFDDNGKMHHFKDLQKQNVDWHRVRINVTTFGEGKQNDTSQLYHVTEQSVNNSAANVMLAFPLTDDFKPRTDDEAKKLVNFVPLRTSPLGFHVHSDFEFKDGRHGMVLTSAHNLSIKDPIATAFFQAILQFLDHQTLCYRWPLFLTPRVRDSDPFWSDLDADVRSWIAQNPVLKSRHSRHWRHISHLTILSADAEDGGKNPLLDDPVNDPFLSYKYPANVAVKLNEYGLETLSSSQFLNLLEQDLKSPSPKMHTFTSKDWHNAISRLLLKFFTNEEHAEKMKTLPLLQLQDGGWTSISSGPLYFPTAGDARIPETLNLRLVSHAANDDPDRRSLYQQLGVSEATAIEIRKMIFDSFKSSETLSLDVVKSYLHYLYLTHQSFDINNEQPYDEVKILTIDMKLLNPRSTIVYLPGKDTPYSPESLLCSDESESDPHASFLHPEIAKDGPKQPGIFHPIWKSWLWDSIGIRYRLSLLQPKLQAQSEESNKDDSSTDDENEVLSDAFHYVFKHRPDRFLGLLEHLWAYEGPQLLKDPTLVSKIKGLPAQTLCGVDFSLELQDAWVPSLYLRSCVNEFMEHPNDFAFLKLDEDKHIDLALASKWSFLTKHFAVKWKYDMYFLLEILKSIKRRSNTTISSSQIQKVLALYAIISARFLICASEEKEQALEFFGDSGILYLDDKGPTWASSSSCVWDAPSDMVSAYSLKSFYENKSLNDQQMESLSRLFHKELSIRDATCEDLVEELTVLGGGDCDDLDRVRGIYKYLDKMTGHSELR